MNTEKGPKIGLTEVNKSFETLCLLYLHIATGSGSGAHSFPLYYVLLP